MRRWLTFLLPIIACALPAILVVAGDLPFATFLPLIQGGGPTLPASPTATPSATASVTPTGRWTATPSQTPTATASPTPSFTASPTPTATPSASPTATPTSSASPTATPSQTPTATPTSLPALEVVSHRRYVDSYSGLLHFVGEIRNNSQSNYGFLRVSIELRQDGIPVHSASGFAMLSSIRPGELAPFDVALLPPPRYDTYTITPAGSPTANEPVDDFAILGQRTFTDTLHNLWVAGEVRNDLDSNAAFVLIVGTFYDTGGLVWNAGQSYSLLTRLAPGQRSPFKVAVPYTAEIASHRLVTRGIANAAAPRSDLTILNSAATVQAGVLTLGGQVRNDGSTDASSVSVVGTLYDATGRVVNAAAADASPASLPPGAVASFQIVLVENWDGYQRYELQAQGF